MSNKDFDFEPIVTSDYEREILREISKDTSGNGNIDFHEWMEGFPELHEDEGMWEEMESASRKITISSKIWKRRSPTLMIPTSRIWRCDFPPTPSLWVSCFRTQMIHSHHP